MKSQLTSDQWDKIENKYGKLIHTICQMISGDQALCSHEDLYSDLCIAAIEAVIGFQKKYNKPFDEIIDDPIFNKYIKTCLWNYKNNRGTKLTKKMHIRKCIPLVWEEDKDGKHFDSQAADFMVSKEDPSFGVELEFTNKFIESTLDKEQLNLIEYIVDNPDLLKKNGKVNRAALSDKLSKNWAHIDSQLNSISKLVGIEL